MQHSPLAETAAEEAPASAAAGAGLTFKMDRLWRDLQIAELVEVDEVPGELLYNLGRVGHLRLHGDDEVDVDALRLGNVVSRFHGVHGGVGHPKDVGADVPLSHWVLLADHQLHLGSRGGGEGELSGIGRRREWGGWDRPQKGMGRVGSAAEGNVLSGIGRRRERGWWDRPQ